MSHFLSFLKTAKVEEAEVKARKAGGGGTRKQWQPNPSLLAIRLWKDGRAFPSDALISQFDLEYKEAAIEKQPLPLKEGQTAADQKYKNVYTYIAGPGNGLDVIDSRSWRQYKGEGHLLFVSPVERSKARVDLFSSVGYDEQGTPKSTVADQGAATFGKDVLLDLVKEVYGIELNDEKPYIDLLVSSKPDGETDVTELFSRDVALYPKRVARGEDKGKPDYIRREKSKVYAFVPAELLSGTIGGIIGGTIGDQADEDGHHDEAEE